MSTPLAWRKKPVEIEAFQYDGLNAVEIGDWAGREFAEKCSYPPMLVIPTLEGQHLATVGDFIIRGVKGEFYPCKPDIFAMTYEPATPAPESPAPAPAGFATWWESYRRWDDDFRYPASEEGEHKATAFAAWQAAQSPVTPRDIGTGSETSPDAGASREAVKDAIIDYDDGNISLDAATNKILSLLAKPAEQREAEQIPHPVAEAEQSPLPAALDALRKLERACQDLGSTALPVWDYNPPDYLKKEWEVLADMLVEVAPALAQAPTRNAGEAQ